MATTLQIIGKERFGNLQEITMDTITDFVNKPPAWFTGLAPAGVMYWYIFLGVAGLVSLIILFFLFRAIKGIFGGSGGGQKSKKNESNLIENLGEYPKPKTSTGDQQLLIERVPCRLRLVAIAPAGKLDEIDPDEISEMLNKVVPGLGDICDTDKPRVRVWPMQVSYEGFAKHFHRNTITPEEEGEPTPWVIVAGRCKLGKQQIMLGLAARALKPTTVGRRTYDSHEWASAVRVRIHER
jgi:hypothetical protein